MAAVAQAVALAAQVHKEHLDKGGEPYILHCIRVMQKVRERGANETVQIIAVLHDTIEDASGLWTPQMVRETIEDQYNTTILRGVVLLTRQEGEDYLASYIPRIKDSTIGTMIKLADLEDNLNPLRQPTLRDKDLLRLQKYHMAYRILRNWDDFCTSS